MTRRLLALAIAFGLVAAPAADAARSCAAMPTTCSCCAPVGPAPGCDMACSPDHAPGAVVLAVSPPSTVSPSTALTAAWLVTERRWPRRLTPRIGPVALGAAPAPPHKRYLLACILRL